MALQGAALIHAWGGAFNLSLARFRRAHETHVIFELRCSSRLRASVNLVRAGRAVAGLARTGWFRNFPRAQTALVLEHKPKRTLADALARAWEFNTGSLGQPSFCYPTYRKGEPLHCHLFQPPGREAALANVCALLAEGNYVSGEPAVLILAGRGWKTRDRVVRLSGSLLL